MTGGLVLMTTNTGTTAGTITITITIRGMHISPGAFGTIHTILTGTIPGHPGILHIVQLFITKTRLFITEDIAAIIYQPTITVHTTPRICR